MNKDIHPIYHPAATITCACGNIITVGSTLPEIRTEVCSNCHPFYTGKQKLVDTAHRVEKFEAKLASKAKVETGAGRTAKRAALKEKRKTKIAVRKKPTVHKLGHKPVKVKKMSAKPKAKPEQTKDK